MSHALTYERRGLLVACLALGAADLAFIDAVALPRVMRGRADAHVVASHVAGHPPPTPPTLRAGGEPSVAVRASVSASALLPRVRAGEVGRGSPSTGDVPPAQKNPTIVPTPALELTLHFATADASLNARTGAALDAIAAQAAEHPGWTFAVNGHADARGDAAFNARLSELRAAAVAARLEAAGIPAARVQTTAFGATRPLSAGDDPASLRRNRRVEILIVRGGP